jgi:hypothetical protein
MSVENILHPVLNPVRDDMSVAADDGRMAYGVSSLTGFFRENDLFFYRHPVPDGTLGQDTTRNVPMSVEKQRIDVFVIFFCLSSEIETRNDDRMWLSDTPFWTYISGIASWLVNVLPAGW